MMNQRGLRLLFVDPYDERSAIVVVDVQNDFADPAGSLYVRSGEAVVPIINAQIQLARSVGAAVLYTQDWHPASTPHFSTDGGIWPPHCVEETWGAQLHPDLNVAGEVVRKGSGSSDGYSGFGVRDPRSGETTPTSLDSMLGEKNIRRLVVCGLATDYCVLETVLDGAKLGYEVQVLVDAISAVELQAGDGKRALERMLEAGARLF
jgi:nicotinamidase/pyrazinamidase